MGMFVWDNGGIWSISIPGRPALDWITASLFSLGSVFLLVRYLRDRDWRYLYTLISIPILVLPSVMSLAFPQENPAPNRAAGAIVPVFTLAAFPLALTWRWVKTTWRERRGQVLGGALILALLTISGATNHRLVFHQFAELNRLTSWNTGEAAAVVRGFAESIGSFEKAYVVPYPHWMDTRLVGMQAGTPRIDYATPPETFESLSEEEGPLLFLLKPEDEENLNRLRSLFPGGILTHYDSEIEGKDFSIFFVPVETDL